MLISPAYPEEAVSNTEGGRSTPGSSKGGFGGEQEEYNSAVKGKSRYAESHQGVLKPQNEQR